MPHGPPKPLLQLYTGQLYKKQVKFGNYQIMLLVIFIVNQYDYLSCIIVYNDNSSTGHFCPDQ